MLYCLDRIIFDSFSYVVHIILSFGRIYNYKYNRHFYKNISYLLIDKIEMDVWMDI